MKDEIRILGIESSCDETAAAVVADGRKVLSSVIFSQIDIHRSYGGVVPEIASRSHIEKINQVTGLALENAGLEIGDVDAVAVTYGPGLVGALLVGVNFAKALSYAAGKPLIGVHHIEGHICSNFIENYDFQPPFVCLVASGGHTNLVYAEDYGTYRILGKTKDDAAGEAYDKVARALGLPYPGGVEIDRLSQRGNPKAIKFPRASLGADSLDFSFSGLKSAVLNYLNSAEMNGQTVNPSDVAASFQAAVVEVLTDKAVAACKAAGCKSLGLAGGVSCNAALRKAMGEKAEKNGLSLTLPLPVYCTDNGAMIASCGYYGFLKKSFAGLDLNAYPNLPIGVC